AQHGDSQDRSVAYEPLGRALSVVGIGEHVWDVDRAALGGGAPGCGSRSDLAGTRASELPVLRRLALVGLEVEELTLDPADHGVGSAAEPGRALDQRGQDQREVERRAADRLEDLPGRRLALERTRQLAIADLKLREEPDVLDGDHRLGCERLEER